MNGHGNGARFVVLDGLDGCGKSTQAAELAAWFTAHSGKPALHLREPGSTAAGERIRALLLDRETGLSPESQVLLLAAARRQMLDELVAPALAAGRPVVCERFHPSTFAYQGTAGGVDEERLLALLFAWAGTPAPDLTVILELEPAAAARRRGASDRFESRPSEFHRAVAEGYRRYAARVPGVVVVPATGSVEEVAARIRAEVERGVR
jgi:dTMP kinase